MRITDFSIVTPSFNQAQFVTKTLESVRNQQGVSIQHVVVDPGSSDGSRDIIRSFPHVTLIDKKDSCQSEGINNGFAECTGHIMAWLNSDDIYPSNDVLQQVKQCFDNNPDIDVMYGKAIFIDDSGKFLRDYYVNGKSETLSETLEYQVGICQPAVFWRREVFDKLGGLDESLEFQLDYEYWIRFTQAGLRWKHLNIILAAHRWWEGMKTSSKRELSLRESLNLVKKKFGYVHFKWAERLAAMEVSGSDGIINVKQSGDAAVVTRQFGILRYVNTDAKTLECLQSSTASTGMRETLAMMRNGGIEIQPKFLDAKAIEWEEKPLRFVYSGDENHSSTARRPEIRTQKQVNLDHVVYCAEPNFCVAQLIGPYHSDQKRLKKFLDQCHTNKEKTCVVVANGPSLRESLNEELLAFDLIISNFAYKDERLLQSAKYFTIVNHTVAAQVYADWMYLNGLIKIFPFWLGRYVPQLDNTYFVNSTVVPEFSPDAHRYLSWRSTVSYFNIQLAYSLGYRRILLVGFDNSYVQPLTVREGDELDQKKDDPNHFMANYFKGKTWQAADTGNMNDSYCEALKFTMQHDVQIINCTIGGQLHVFPRASLAQFIKTANKDNDDDLNCSAKWSLLTPGEISAMAKFPEIRAEFENGSFDYSKLPLEVQAHLLDIAHDAGRKPVPPYHVLK